jgi:ceramide glucosyltransferase
MMPAASHDVLVVADSDIKVGPNYLTDIVSDLQQPNVGAVTCLYHGIGGAGVWSWLAATAINMHFLPQVIVALRFRLAQPCFGATIAMRRETLNRIGGFSAFADYLAEDYAIGEAVRGLGQKVVIPHFIVGHVCFERDFAALLAQQFRFARTIRTIDPIGYAGSIVAHPFPLALIAALMGANQGALLLTAVLACRGVLCMSIKRALGLANQPYWLIPIQDLISFLAFIVGFFEIGVSWRGHRYRVLPDGRLVADQSEGTS